MPLPYRILIVQAVTAAVASLLCWISGELYWISGNGAVSAMTAAVVVLVPNAWFAWRVVSAATLPEPALNAGAVRSVIGGGIAKLLATGALMAMALVWVRPQPLAFFGTFIALQVVYWLAPLLDAPPRSRPRQPGDG